MRHWASSGLTGSLSFTLVSSKNRLNNDEFQPTGHWVIGQEYHCQTAGVIRNPQEHLSGDSLEYSWPYLHIPLFFTHNKAKDKSWPAQDLYVRAWVFPAPGLIIRWCDTLETGDMSHVTHVTYTYSVRLIAPARYSSLIRLSWHHGNNQLSWLSTAILMIRLKILILSIKITRMRALMPRRLKVKLRIVKIKTRLSISMVSHWWMVVSYSRSPQSDIPHLDYVRNSAKIFPQTGGHQYLRRFTTHCFSLVLLIHDFL